MNDFVTVTEHVPSSQGRYTRDIAIRRSAIQYVTAPAKDTSGKHYWVRISSLDLW